MKLTPERLFSREPLAGAAAPSRLTMSADGRYGCCLLPAEEDRERLELWLMDLTAVQEHGSERSVAARRLLSGTEFGERSGAPEQADERERRRQFAHGVTAYEWHPSKHHLLIPAGGVAWVLDLAETAPAGAGAGLRQLTPPDTRQTAIRYSAQGNCLSYVRDGDLYRLDIASGQETRLTHDGGGTVRNGLAEFIAQEEMRRFDGHWWSPDERFIAFARVDDAPIPETHRLDVDGNAVAQRYPFAGGPNAEVRLGLVASDGSEAQWLDWALADDDYLARVAFAPDGALVVQAQSRDQRRLALRRFADCRWHEVLTERHDTWVNLHDNLKFLDDGRFVWTSQREELLLYQPDGSHHTLGLRVHPWATVRVLAVDDGSAWVLAREHHVEGLQRHCVVRAPFRAAGSYKAWSVSDYRHAVDAVKCKAPKFGVVLGVNYGTSAPGISFLDEHGGHFDVSFQDRPAPVADLRRYEHRTIRPTPGAPEETLYGRLTWPTPFDPKRRYPVIVHVYGGPGAQMVRPEQPPPVLQLFAQAGFGVFELDNRGTANRGKRFEDHLHGRLGQVEVADQLRGVEFLRGLDWVDAGRIGIFGHSYGGYMVLMCLAASHAFRAGVAVAPVTDWSLYDTHYTERYLGKPQDNPRSYRESSPLPQAGHIDAPLLLMHGMADDNVLFAHSVKLIRALQAAGKQFELMTYPGAKHSLQERAVATHRYRCILEFFRRKLAA